MFIYKIVCNYFLVFDNILGNSCLVVFLTGAGGNNPICPNIHATRSDGCAPTNIQYFNLSESAVNSFILSLFGIGLYDPIYTSYI